MALKGVAKYLRRTQDWGLVYWRSAPATALDDIPFKVLTPDPTLPEFPSALDYFQFVMAVDAAHANEYFQARSTTGYAGLLAGASVVYRCKTQPVTAQNTTESETVSACSGGKVAKYFCSVLKEPGYPQDGPTPIYL